jgi:O-antigen ligase
VITFILFAGTRDRPTGYTPRTTPGALYWIFFLYLFVRCMIAALDHLDLVWLRDAVPFFYVGIGIVSASAIARSSERTRRLTMSILWSALLFHLAWTSVILVGGVDPEGFPSFPGAPIPIGKVRPDIDCAILGVTAILLLRRILRRERASASAVLLVLSFMAIGGMVTRGGFLSVGIVFAVGLLIIYSAAPRGSSKRTTIFAVITAVIIAAVAYLPSTEGGQRLIATVNPAAATNYDAAQRAMGTENARNEAWDLVIDWTQETQTREFFGSGPGPNFIVESGARSVLEGTDYSGVRSPHNWFIGLYARIGTIGVVLAVLVLCAIGHSMWANRRRIGSDELLFTSAMIVAAILPIAAVGVVLESPFGAVPFWWAAGIVLACAKPMPSRQLQRKSNEVDRQA